MADCKHGTDKDKYECIKCENEWVALDKWWSKYLFESNPSNVYFVINSSLPVVRSNTIHGRRI